jgi:hypothetical protein
MAKKPRDGVVSRAGSDGHKGHRCSEETRTKPLHRSPTVTTSAKVPLTVLAFGGTGVSGVAWSARQRCDHQSTADFGPFSPRKNLTVLQASGGLSVFRLYVVIR